MPHDTYMNLIYCKNIDEFNNLQDFLLSNGYKWIVTGKKKLKIDRFPKCGIVFYLVHEYGNYHLMYDEYNLVEKENRKTIISYDEYMKSKYGIVNEIEKIFEDMI